MNLDLAEIGKCSECGCSIIKVPPEPGQICFQNMPKELDEICILCVMGIRPGEVILVTQQLYLFDCPNCLDRGWVASERNTEKPCPCPAGRRLRNERE